MTLPVDIFIELIVFMIVVAVALALMRTGAAVTNVQRRLGQQGRSGAQATSPLVKSQDVSNPFLLWVRLYWGIPLMLNGWGKLHNLPRVTEFFASLGIPLPGVNAPQNKLPSRRG